MRMQHDTRWLGMLVASIVAYGCSASSDAPVQEESLAEVGTDPIGTVAAIVPGAMGGSFKATAQGNASYTIPIQVPTGTAGMQPGLSLSYSNGGAGVGILGQGWSLTGLGAVTRCAATIAQDGRAGTVNYEAGDKFCLDGVRLVQTSAVTSGTAPYWEYRTELESFARVRAYGQPSNPAQNVAHNPAYWEVVTKTGQRMLYGSTADSQIQSAVPYAGQPAVAAVRLWALARVEDKKGNYLSVAYAKGAEPSFLFLGSVFNGEFYPTRIDYTGNAAAGLAPKQAVVFGYEDRPDSRKGFFAGGMVANTKRLTSIRTYVNGSTLVRDYRVAYSTGLLARSLVSELQECGADNKCYAPTRFSYQGGSHGLKTATKWGVNLTAKAKAADFNGDGVSDLYEVQAGQALVALSNRRGFVAPAAWGTGFSDASAVVTADVNADGKSDLVAIDSSGVAKAWLSTGSALQPARTWGTGLDTDPARNQLADVDGDGIVDALSFGTNGVVRLHKGGTTGFAAPVTWATGVVATNIQSIPTSGPDSMDAIRLGDFNGDGLPDIATLHSSPIYGTSSQEIYKVFINQGTGVAAPVDWLTWVSARVIPRKEIHVADVNGDGRDDLVHIYDSALAMLSTGRQFWQNVWSPSAKATDGLVDLNADGLVDLVRLESQANGTSFALKTAHNSGSAFGGWTTWSSMDPRSVVSVTGGPCTSSMTAEAYCQSKKFDGGANITCSHTSCTQYAADGTTCLQWTGTATAAGCYKTGNLGMQMGDFNGDGRLDVALIRDLEKSVFVSASQEGNTDALISVTNGIGHRTEIEYAPLTDGLYTPETAAPPLQLLVGGAYVVKAVREVNAVDGMKTTSFQYWNGKVDPRGRNFLGFRKVSRMTAQADGSVLVTNTEFSQSFPFVGSPTAETKEAWTPSGPVLFAKRSLSTTAISYAQKSWATPGQPTRYFPYTSRTVESGKDLDGSALPTTTTTSTFDDEGNLTKSVVVAGDITTTTTNTFPVADKARWIWGRLSRSVTTKTDGTLTTTRKVAFEYDAATGILTKEIVEPDDATLRMVTAYGHDAFGNKTSTTVSAADVPARVSKVTYDPSGRFVVAQENAAHHVQKFGYDDPTLNVPTTVTDPNGLVSTRTYDSLGRELTEKRPDGVTSTTTITNVAGPILYDHPSRFCSNGVDACSTPSRARSASPLAGGPQGARADGCSVGYWFAGSGAGATCAGNPVNGTCPQSLALGTFDMAEAKTLFGLQVNHVDGLLCYPANVPVYAVGPVLLATTTTPGMPTTKVYTDVLGREVRREHTGFDGRSVIEEQVYDADGRLVKKSLPYLAGETIYWITTQYDVLGRPTQVKEPDSGVTTTQYKGLTKVVTNPKKQVTTVVSNAQGKVVSLTDAKNGIVTYQYNPNGDLLETRDPAGNVTKMTFDARGRKRSMQDPDMGLIEYEYNGVGEATGEQSPVLRAAGKWIRTTYDDIGRMISRDEAGAVSTWVYDTCTKGKGHLCSAQSPGYSRTTTYDTLSRPSQETVTLDGTAYTTTTTYDGFSRVATVTYPGGLKIQEQYNSAGHLASVRDVTSGVLYWQGVSANAAGQFTQEKLGNGVVTSRTLDPATGALTLVQSGPAGAPTRVQNTRYTYDLLSNTKTREDLVTGFSESFEYDELSRLTTVTPTKVPATLKGTKPVQLVVDYDATGNIRSKSDVGSFTYGTLPHAVTLAGTKAYQYDANGNMKGGSGRTITWTAFNMPKRIEGQGGVFAEFSYSPERHRFKQVANTETTYYPSAQFERVIKTGVTSDRSIVFAGQTPIVQITKRGSVSETRYLHHDHQESVSVVTSETGVVLERLAYDAFGKRRHEDGSNASVIAVQSGVTRGYTGHEMLDSLGLVHMNGRIQDPVLGRFLSADPFVQAPENTQSFNRYSYVVNNPLSLVDPSGFNFLSKLWKGIKKFFKKIGRYIVAIVAIAFIVIPGLQALLPAVLQAVLAVGALKAAIVGAIIGFAMGGTLKSALMGAFTGALGYGIGVVANGNLLAEVMAHGMTGGMLSVANGGDFFTGFLASAAGTFLSAKTAGWVKTISRSEAVRTCVGAAASAVVGGATSVLGGGKFENGAVSAAFTYLVEGMVHYGRRRDFLTTMATWMEKDLPMFENPDGVHGGPAYIQPIPVKDWAWGVDNRYPELQGLYPPMSDNALAQYDYVTGQALLNAGDYLHGDRGVDDMAHAMIHETLHANQSPLILKSRREAPGLYEDSWHRMLDYDAYDIAVALSYRPPWKPGSW